MVFIIVFLLLIVVIVYLNLPMFGKLPSGKHLDAIKLSKNYKDGKFRNIESIILINSFHMLKSLTHLIFAKKRESFPKREIPTTKTDLLKLDSQEDVLVWFGHSSYFLQIEGKKILVDPVFSQTASPILFTMQAFSGTHIYNVTDIPEVDYLIITHDHWDHLDYKTIKGLENKIKRVICPIGVGSHLRFWGLNSSQISEIDWYNGITTDEGFRFFCLPSVHFSGRGIVRNKTLWGSFLIETPELFNIFIGCDGGYGKHFSEIGLRFKTIDLAILENGQYNKHWEQIHMHPNEVVQAAIDLRARRVLPIHSAKFKLSTHPWYEPLETISKLSKNKNFKLLTPMIGEIVYFKNNDQQFQQWWQI